LPRGSENLPKKCDGLLTAEKVVAYNPAIDDAPPATGR
jgi:hypothetical protein